MPLEIAPFDNSTSVCPAATTEYTAELLEAVNVYLLIVQGIVVGMIGIIGVFLTVSLMIVIGVYKELHKRTFILSLQLLVLDLVFCCADQWVDLCHYDSKKVGVWSGDVFHYWNSGVLGFVMEMCNTFCSGFRQIPDSFLSIFIQTSSKEGFGPSFCIIICSLLSNSYGPSVWIRML